VTGPPESIRRIVVLGGGTAGWMAASALAKVVGCDHVAVTLVESEAIGTVGVGEATIPPILMFNRLLGIDEREFIRETGATFKLGIVFEDWLRLGHRYTHSFGLFGADMNGVPFTQYWLRAVADGLNDDRDGYNAEAQAIALGRFGRPETGRDGKVPRINHAYHFDAGRYAGFLRRFAEGLGVVRIEGRVAEVERDRHDGLLRAMRLEDGREIEGDLFVDCSGFRGLLIEETLGAGYEDWSHWLPANRAVAAASPRTDRLPPFTVATARDAGWQWRIPLQHRTGNGYVFCDAFQNEADATDRLIRALGPTSEAPRMLRFVTGRRRRQWIGNCLSLGLAAGFLEPLESTSIHLVQAGIAKLLALFPRRRSEPVLADRYNREMAALFDGIRDFLVAHYVLTDRDDTPLWRHMRAMPIPDSLADRLAMFRDRGEAGVGGAELFRETNWFAVLHGQGLVPEGRHPIADAMPREVLAERMMTIRDVIARRVAGLPDHDAYLRTLIGATR